MKIRIIKESTKRSKQRALKEEDSFHKSGRGSGESTRDFEKEVGDPHEGEEGLKLQLYKLQSKMDMLWSNGEGLTSEGYDTPEMAKLTSKRNVIAKKLNIPDAQSLRGLINTLDKEYHERFGSAGPYGEWAEEDADDGFGSGWTEEDVRVTEA